MAPVIWGLDLREITWAKFGNKNMWSNHYHLRRTKFIVYQLAMIFCVVSESLGTAAMSDYLDQKEVIEPLDSNAHENVSDYVGAASYNIFAGVYVAFIFGGAFFFDLIWPERYESPMVRTAWRVCSVSAIIFHGAAAFALTVITARNSATITGVDSARLADLLGRAKYSPLEYRTNGRAVAACVFIWPGWLAVIASTIVMYMSLGNEDRFGTTIAAHDRTGNEKMELEMRHKGTVVNATNKPLTTPSTAHSQVPSEQPLVDRAGPSFENDTTAAIDGVRRSPQDNTVASTSVPSSTGNHAGRTETTSRPQLG